MSSTISTLLPECLPSSRASTTDSRLVLLMVLPGVHLGRAHEGPSSPGGGRRQVLLCYHNEGP